MNICFQFWIYNKSNGSVTLHAKLFILYSENKFIYFNLKSNQIVLAWKVYVS